ncbi:MAG: hypothetical protein ABIP39_08390 [Polyangiaceae bacterium]
MSALAASAATYVYQLLAARALDDVQFAQLNLWLFWVSLASVVGIVLQYSVSLHAKARAPARGTGFALLSAASLLLLLLVLVRATALPWISGALAVVTCLSFGYVTGTFQALTWVRALAASNLTLGLSRLAFVLAVGMDAEGFRRAFAASNAMATMVGAFVFLASSKSEIAPLEAAHGPTPKLSSRLVGATILAVAGSLFQFADFLVVSGSQTQESAGIFGQAQTLGRSLFFLGLIGLQVLYPYQLRFARGDQPSRLRWWLRHGEAGLFAILTVAAVALTAVAPWFLVNVLHKTSSAPRAWIALSSANFLLLSAIFGRIQRGIAFRSLRLPVLLLGFLVLSVLVLSHVMRGHSTTTALLFATLFYGLAMVAGLALRDPRAEA